jgi:hypothetical protein
VPLVPPLEVGRLTLPSRELKPHYVQVVVEITIEIETANFDQSQPRDSVGHVCPPSPSARAIDSYQLSRARPAHLVVESPIKLGVKGSGVKIASGRAESKGAKSKTRGAG